MRQAYSGDRVSIDIIRDSEKMTPGRHGAEEGRVWKGAVVFKKFQPMPGHE